MYFSLSCGIVKRYKQSIKTASRWIFHWLAESRFHGQEIKAARLTVSLSRHFNTLAKSYHFSLWPTLLWDTLCKQVKTKPLLLKCVRQQRKLASKVSSNFTTQSSVRGLAHHCWPHTPQFVNIERVYRLQLPIATIFLSRSWWAKMTVHTTRTTGKNSFRGIATIKPLLTLALKRVSNAQICPDYCLCVYPA